MVSILKKFKHLSLIEREILYGGLKQGLSLREIGRRLKRDHTSLSDELKRNIRYGNCYFGNKYLPCKAQVLADKRNLKQRQKAPLKNPKVFVYVRKKLRKGVSPETIAGRLPIDYPGEHIDDETIYRYIYSSGMKRYRYWQYLILQRKKRMKKDGRKVKRDGKIPGSISIDLRPKEVNLRNTLGHWETDNVIGRQSDKTALSVTVERLTRITIITKLKNRSATAKTAALVSRLGELPGQTRLTITTDNGKENSYHKLLTDKLGTDVFFCHAYHSWEKGTVENTNGRIRRYIPKGVSIDSITDKKVRMIERKLNNTPRKCLGYLTPNETMIRALS